MFSKVHLVTPIDIVAHIRSHRSRSTSGHTDRESASGHKAFRTILQKTFSRSFRCKNGQNRSNGSKDMARRDIYVTCDVILSSAANLFLQLVRQEKLYRSFWCENGKNRSTGSKDIEAICSEIQFHAKLMNIHELLMSIHLPCLNLSCGLGLGWRRMVLAYFVDRIRGFHDISFEFLYLVWGRRR